MKKTMLVVAVVAAFFAGNVQAQSGKARKKEAVAEAKANVASDKAALKELKSDRQDDKLRGDRQALKADRKRTFKADKKLLKDEVKKDAAVVKEKL
ncbi:hypothetical protein FAES_pFAES01030 (plasmid) [Fibrella aestuarina BUZ 2]|uniref:Uncharacterized protein n=1 Tax=Fibrella aestuarina BUZ 2 TaxID=1166018 RepID=I0KHC1_9BACT|nr:hypothetical protein [Fibrella aestuarina]CCH03524.1 hypothetical protein FAES_pFAES01030 [Fibrella aestuarina BUZ 2]